VGPLTAEALFLPAAFQTPCVHAHRSYHVYSLSEGGRVATAIALKAIAHLFETAVFGYVGVEIFTRSRDEHGAHAALDGARSSGIAICTNGSYSDGGGCMPGVASGSSVFGFTCLSVLLVLLSRVVVVPPLVWLANLFRPRSMHLSPVKGVALVAAGLRGAIAYALSKSVRSYHQVNMTAAAVGTIFVTVFIIGGGTRRLLTSLGLTRNADDNAREVIKVRNSERREEADRKRERKLADGVEGGATKRGQAKQLVRKVLYKLRHLDADVLRPLFIYRYDPSGFATEGEATGRGEPISVAAAGVQLAVTEKNGVSPPMAMASDAALSHLDASRIATAGGGSYADTILTRPK
jgi:hypothetical protein